MNAEVFILSRIKYLRKGNLDVFVVKVPQPADWVAGSRLSCTLLKMLTMGIKKKQTNKKNPETLFLFVIKSAF